MHPGLAPPSASIGPVRGNWDLYLGAVYEVFSHDFHKTRPNFQGRRLGLKSHPLTKEKECTFWHLIEEGPDEKDRIPNLARCERISWVRAIIERVHTHPDDVRVWAQDIQAKKGGKERRWHLALSDFSYLVVLADREKYLLPWTAFPVEHSHQRRKREKQWREHRPQNEQTGA